MHPETREFRPLPIERQQAELESSPIYVAKMEKELSLIKCVNCGVDLWHEQLLELMLRFKSLSEQSRQPALKSGFGSLRQFLTYGGDYSIIRLIKNNSIKMKISFKSIKEKKKIEIHTISTNSF